MVDWQSPEVVARTSGESSIPLLEGLKISAGRSVVKILG